VSVIQSIRDFINDCPLLKDGCLNVDRLGSEAIEYTIDTTPCEPILKKYVDGSSLRQIEFVFASRELYGSDILQNLANSDFYEKFADWIESQNNLRSFPVLEEFRKSQKLETITNGYIYDTGDNSARYQIQLKLTYYQDRRYNNG
jgi:hypothetical protein